MADSKTKPKPLLVLEDGAIVSMSTSPAFVKEFPFLAAVAASSVTKNGKRCAPCGRARAAQTATTSVIASAKSALAYMDGTRKRKLKEMLNATRIRVFFRSNTGKLTALTF